MLPLYWSAFIRLINYIFSNMRRILFFVVLVFAFISVKAVANTNETNQEIGTVEQQTQTVNAIYVANGINSLLIRISGGYVVAYCSGYDYQGRQVWEEIQPTKINKNPKCAVSSDPTVNMEIQKRQYTAQIGNLTIYF